ncbi:hypothetical protein MGSAQ_002575 [marine sediment metagenome]|uniref:Uncharacterized protein n=1 Tax=marine sediment metagenome TaxID=412755 RepID=A0A1B6NR52_9ZZZZ
MLVIQRVQDKRKRYSLGLVIKACRRYYGLVRAKRRLSPSK